MKKGFVSKVNIKNKRASFDFLLLDLYTAGIVLTGTEIKSIRAGKASLVDTYCLIINGEVWVKNMYVAHYEHGSYNNHVERRDRKLLLNRRELDKIRRTLQDKGITVVGLRTFINERGLAKVAIGLARGRKAYDKREYLKANDAKREMDKAMKNYN